MIESSHNRFSNSLGSEYNLFKEGVPHHEEFQDRVGEIVRDYALQLQGDTITALEAGVGTGFTARRILNADPRITLLGIDNEEKTLSQARMALAEFEDRIHYLQEDVLVALRTLPDMSINIFASVLTIHNFPPQYRKQLFVEIARTLKPGGLFVNGDKYAHDDEQVHRQAFQESIMDYEAFIARDRPDLKRDWIRHDLEDDKIKITESEQARILHDLKFHDITWEYRKKMHAIVKAIR